MLKSNTSLSSRAFFLRVLLSLAVSIYSFACFADQSQQLQVYTQQQQKQSLPQTAPQTASQTAPQKIQKNESIISGGIPIIPGSPLKAFTYTLPNELRLVVIPDFRNTLATINFILNAGSDREVLGKTGLAHFFEHMMFRKTQTMAEGNYDRVLSAVGGSGNAGTSDSLVTFYSSFPAPALQSVLQLESQRFLALDVTDPYFSIEKGAVISERKLRVENDPFQRGYEIIRSIVERDTPLQWMVIGAKKDVEGLDIKTAQKFYNDFYRPNNVILVVGGPFQPESVEKLVATYFGSWQGTAPKNESQYPTNYLTRDLGKEFVCSEQVSTKNLNFIYPSFDSSLKSQVYASLFVAMLDDNPKGSFEYRLQVQNIANGFGFNKSYDGTKSNPLIASFSLSSGQKIDKVKTFWNNAVHDILNKSLPERLLKQAIKQEKVYDANVAEKLSSVAELVTENAYFFKNPAAQEEKMKILQTMTPNDFALWVKTNFAGNKYYITGVVPMSDAPTCESLLRK